MITEIRLNNFKSFEASRLKMSRVTFLIGANASGKSNVLEALKFASWMGHGDRLDDIEKRLGKSGSIRGGVRNLFLCGQKAVVAGDTTAPIVGVGPSAKEFKIGFDVTSETKGYRFEQTIREHEFSDTSRHLVVSAEELACVGQRQPLFRIKPNGTSADSEAVKVAWDNGKSGGQRPVVTCSNRRAIFQQMKDDDRFGMKPGTSPVANASRALAEILDNIHFVSPDVSKMRGYVQIQSGVRLDEDGGNLSSVIYDLCKNKKTKSQLTEFIRAIPEQNIRSIQFVRTSANDVMVALAEGFAAFESTPASILSDGTLRVLAIGAALFSATAGATVVIEEVDNGIHPSRAKHLVSQFYDIAAARDIQIVLTTHNPALMDAVPQDELPNVLCAYRDPDALTSCIRRLGDMPQYANLAIRGSLGRAATGDELEHMVTDSRSEKEIRVQRMSWIEDFMAARGGAS